MSLAACASTPPPTGLIDDAEAAVAAARDAHADERAAVELGRAEEQLAAARAALGARDYDDAHRYAEQAELNAALAAARSRAAASRDAVQRQSEENARLRRELLGEGARR